VKFIRLELPVHITTAAAITVAAITETEATIAIVITVEVVTALLSLYLQDTATTVTDTVTTAGITTVKTFTSIGTSMLAEM
jgi:hypothetical protein